MDFATMLATTGMSSMTGILGKFPCAAIFSWSSFTTEINQSLDFVACAKSAQHSLWGDWSDILHWWKLWCLGRGSSLQLWACSGDRLARKPWLLLGTIHCLLAADWHPRGNIPASSPVYRHVSPIIWQGKSLSGTPKRLLTPGRSYFKMFLSQNTFFSFPFLPRNNLIPRKIYRPTIFPEEFKWGLRQHFHKQIFVCKPSIPAVPSECQWSLIDSITLLKAGNLQKTL